MQQATGARTILQRLYPWLGRAVHIRWARRRSLYQTEAESLLARLARVQGRTPPELQFELEGFLGRLHREWFPHEWRPHPTYAEVLDDFRWWLQVAERWHEKPTKAKAPKRPKKPPEPLAKQPKELLRRLKLPPECTAAQFTIAWRRFVKAHHPDLHPEQTPAQRRRFAEAVALWRR